LGTADATSFRFGQAKERPQPRPLTASPAAKEAVVPNLEAPPELCSPELAGRRQAAFREVNEQLAKRTGSFVTTLHRLFVCECADPNCAESLEITEAEYAAVRSEGTHFVLVAGHELPDVERVIAANDRFIVVEKVGAAAEVVLAGHGHAS
jgi:hypothetical protein